MLRLSWVTLLLCGSVGACASLPPQNAPRIVVFFSEWSAGLDSGARGAIDAAAARAAAAPDASVWVEGYTDLTGTKQANVLLAETRAQVVTDRLVSDGVALARIRQVVRGKTAYVQSSQESRRAVIVIDQ